MKSCGKASSNSSRGREPGGQLWCQHDVEGGEVVGELVEGADPHNGVHRREWVIVHASATCEARHRARLQNPCTTFATVGSCLLIESAESRVGPPAP
jgi:hypothetical protein